MNRVLLQVWEVSERKIGTSRDGCSLHIDYACLKDFVRMSCVEKSSVPDEYTKVLGLPVEAFVEDAIYSRILSSGSVRITETSLSNLLGLGEIIIKE